MIKCVDCLFCIEMKSDIDDRKFFACYSKIQELLETDPERWRLAPSDVLEKIIEIKPFRKHECSKFKERQTTMKEYELLTNTLTTNILMRYGKDKIEIANKKNLKDIEIIQIPPELLLKVQSFLQQPHMMKAKEWNEIREYVCEVSDAMIKMQLQSSPKERELHVALLKAFFEKLKLDMIDMDLNRSR